MNICDECKKNLRPSLIKWGRHWTSNYRGDPKRLPFVLSRYQFAGKMSGVKGTVLELGCSEGIGAPILAEEASGYLGVDLDKSAIETARQNFQSEKMTFIYDDFMGKSFGTFQAIVSLDVIEHIYPEYESCFFETICNNLAENGRVIVGTPNITSAPYASETSNAGHVNLYAFSRLKGVLQNYFHNVFAFGMNDEVVHTGFAAMSHYVICVACNKNCNIKNDRRN